MHKILTFLLLLIISSCAVSQPAKTLADTASNEHVVYPNNLWLAIGTEPFWNVEIKVGEHIIFTSIGEIDSLGFNYVEPIITTDGKVVFIAKSKEGSIELVFTKEQCSDGMSDDIFIYSTSVKIEKKSSKISLDWRGCGKYVQPTHLNDIWVLSELKGEKVEAAKIPTMELHLRNYKVMGNAGCNGYQGNFTLTRDLIEFDRNFIATRMYCENQDIESAFLQALAGNRFVYEVVDNQLIFKTEGHPILVFKKVD